MLAAALQKGIKEAVAATTEFFERKFEELRVSMDRRCRGVEETMENMLCKKEAQIRELREDNNQLEQYSRRSHLRIHGLTLPEGADCKAAVCNFVRNNLRDPDDQPIDLTPEDIDAAHPLPMKTDATRTPSLIVRFFARDTRDKVIRARRQLKNKKMGKTSLAITEDLTAANASLLRKAVKAPQFCAAWSWQGKIFAKKAPGDRAVKLGLFDL